MPTLPRLFVAAMPDENASAVLRSLARPAEPGIKWVPEANWHVTLRYIGQVEASAVIDELESAVLPTTDALLGPAVERLGGQVVVPVDGVDTLAAAVRRATAPVGDIDPRPFFGHLTIARTRRGATSSVLGSLVSARFAVTRVALIESELRPTGAIYTTVATFPTVEPVSGDRSGQPANR